MSYALIIPPEFLGELVPLREKLRKSIRAMIFEAIKKYIDEKKSGISPALSLPQK